MLKMRNLLLSSLLLSILGCTDNHSLEEAPFKTLDLQYNGNVSSVSFNVVNDSLKAKLSCSEDPSEPSIEYCTLDDAPSLNSAIWRQSGKLKQVRLVFPVIEKLSVQTQAEQHLAQYGLKLDDFKLNQIGDLEASFINANAKVMYHKSSELLSLQLSTFEKDKISEYSEPAKVGKPFMGFSVGQKLTETDIRQLDCRKDLLNIHEVVHHCDVKTDNFGDLYLMVVDSKIYFAALFLYGEREEVENLLEQFYVFAGGKGKITEETLGDGRKTLFMSNPIDGNQALFIADITDSSFYSSGKLFYSTDSHIEELAKRNKKTYRQ